MFRDVDLFSSSKIFLSGVQWLENEVKFNEEKLRDELREKEEELEKASSSDQYGIRRKISLLNTRLSVKYMSTDVEAVYVLKKVNSIVADEFVSAAGDNAFWEDENNSEWFWEDPHKLWFFREVGLGDNPYFLKEVENRVKEQSVEGYFQSNELEHIGTLRVLVMAKPQSKALSTAVDYWLRNWKSLSRDEPDTVAVGVLALTELDHEKYSNFVREEIDYLKSLQNDDGSWKHIHGIRETGYALWAISRVDGIGDSSAQKGLMWLKKRQQENGSWENDSYSTKYALLGLLAMGEGPKVPIELVDYEFMKLNQGFKKQEPVFIHTSPLFQNSLHVRQIYEKIYNMVHKAQREIRITSPFIDMLYEEIINLKQKNPNLTIKVITRPKKEIEGTRGRIARNVVDLLNIATRGNVVQSSLIHSRVVIIDNEEVLVSSADLTRDQLFDEFNAGIWTSNKEIVEKAISFFENLFQLEKQRE